MYFDIHSHILHNIDDGAKEIKESISLLEELANQGVTDVIATPHFYPLMDTLEGFKEKSKTHFLELKKLCKNNLPNIYLGCEVLYYSGISKVPAIKELTLEGSNYILLELCIDSINTQLFSELLYLKSIGIIPIIAHIERYYKAFGYKKLIRFIKENGILTQVNASSFLKKHYNRCLKKLMKEGIITFVASDAHSLKNRPPEINSALQKIEQLYGKETKDGFISRSEELLNEITKR